MRKNEKKEGIKQGKYISGIYNYCDRWCERCPLGHKCLLNAKEEKRLAKHKKKGEDPYDWDIIMQDMKEDFDETIKLLHKMAEERGIDLDVLPDEEYERYDASNHPIMKTANGYLSMAREFLEKLRETIQKEGVDLSKRIEIIPTAEGDITTLRKIVSSYEVIIWYHTLISVKVHRALQGKMESEPGEFSQSDADGSAKVAYIGIMNSMNALKIIYDWDDDLKDSALTLLVEIEKLRKGVDKEFPGHHTFKRPGFDN